MSSQPWPFQLWSKAPRKPATESGLPGWGPGPKAPETTKNAQSDKKKKIPEKTGVWPVDTGISRNLCFFCGFLLPLWAFLPLYIELSKTWRRAKQTQESKRINSQGPSSRFFWNLWYVSSRATFLVLSGVFAKKDMDSEKCSKTEGPAAGSSEFYLSKISVCVSRCQFPLSNIVLSTQKP